MMMLMVGDGDGDGTIKKRPSVIKNEMRRKGRRVYVYVYLYERVGLV